LKLNTDQSTLLIELGKFYHGPNQFFLLAGQAGVGKTTCMKFFAESLKEIDPSVKICMAAPTNKAVAVLSDSVGDPDLTYKTIYSLLGLRMMANGEVKELTDSGQDSIGNYSLVICDEASMVSSVLIDYVLKKTALADTKIVFIGDKEQLPPVGEQKSPIWSQFKINYELTEVMRHQNSILDFVQNIRGNTEPDFISSGPQVHVDTEDEFTAHMQDMARQGHFHTGKAKAIAWRNMTVDFLNDFIRNQFKATQSTDKFVVGDRVVIKEPIIVGETTAASTDEEGTVSSVMITQHSRYPTLRAWHIKIKMDYTQSTVSTYVIHSSSEGELQQMLDQFKQAKRWDLFWKLKEAFGNIAYGYALTAHRSQGSTFENVFVDAGDIMLNRTISDRTKCLYVACSRASKQLRIFP
jgi:exodeoxyribonuclease V